MKNCPTCGAVNMANGGAPPGVGAPPPTNMPDDPAAAAPAQVGAPLPTNPPDEPAEDAPSQVGAPAPTGDTPPIDQNVQAPPSALDDSSPAAATDTPASTPDQPQPDLSGDTSGDGYSGPRTHRASMPPPSPVLAGPALTSEIIDQGNKFQQDITAGHIKPQTYGDLFAKKDTLGKIGTLFGMLVSGAGSGLAHQQNAVLEAMNREIANDFEAQKVNAENKKNFYQLNLQHQLNEAQMKHMSYENALTQGKLSNLPAEQQLLDAQSRNLDTEARVKAQTNARIQSNWAAMDKLTKWTMGLPPGPQRDQAMQSLAMMQQGIQSENYSIASRAGAAMALTSMAPAGNDAEGSYQAKQNMYRMGGKKDLAEANDQRHIPGIKGQASVPLTAEDRSSIQSSQALVGSLQRLKDFSRQHANSIDPKVINEGKALAAQVQGDFRLATHGGVFKEGEQNFINGIVPGDPTKFVPSITVTPRIDAVIKETNARNSQFLQSKGFPPQQQQAKTQEAPQYKISGGKKYMRGKNGEAIEVK